MLDIERDHNVVGRLVADRIIASGRFRHLDAHELSTGIYRFVREVAIGGAVRPFDHYLGLPVPKGWRDYPVTITFDPKLLSELLSNYAALGFPVTGC